MPLAPGRILEVLGRLAGTAAPLWLTGGIAVEFLVGRWTRPHKDIDLVARSSARALLQRELEERGFALAEDGSWTTRWFSPAARGEAPSPEAEAELEIVFVEPAEPDTGVLVMTQGDPAGGAAGRYPLLPGYLDPRRTRTLDGVTFRVCSADGEWLARTRSAELVAGRGPEPKIEHDRRLLEGLVDEARRRELLARC